MADRELLASILQTPIQRVLTDHPDRRSRRDDRSRPIMAVHQKHIWPHGITADLHMIGESRQDPHATPTMQAASRLEIDRATEQLVDERERLMVLDYPITVANDAENLLSVPTHSRVIARDYVLSRPCPIRRTAAPVNCNGLLRDAPAKTGRLNRLANTRRRTIKDSAKTMPRRRANGKHRI